jgi:uncharacterized protein YbjT (DUF2867 family)
MSGPGLRRRSILKWALSAVTAPAALTAAPAGAVTPRSDDPLARALVDLFSHRESAAAIGRAYLLRHPEEADAGILLERIAGPSGNALGGLSSPARRGELRGVVQSLYRRDFDAGRTRTIHGATLALTELRLCALAAIELEK